MLIFWLGKPIRAGEQKGGKNSKQIKAENELKIFVPARLLQKRVGEASFKKKAQPLAKLTP